MMGFYPLGNEMLLGFSFKNHAEISSGYYTFL